MAFKFELLRTRLVDSLSYPRSSDSFPASFVHWPVYPGNLRGEIDDADGLSIDVAHFYIKQILGVVDYLHSHYIFRRDLRSEIFF